MRLQATLSVFAACLLWQSLLCSASDSLLERHQESDGLGSDGLIFHASTPRGLKKSKGGKSAKAQAYYDPSYIYYRPYVPVYGGYGPNGGYGGGGYGGYYGGYYDYNDLESGSKKSKAYMQYPIFYNPKSGKKGQGSPDYIVVNPDRPPAIREPTKTIYEIISEIPNLSTLASLVDSQGQEEVLQTLDGDGPVTLFAPLNSAFNALFETVDPSSLTDAELTNALEYHIVAGRLLKRHLIMGGRGVIYALNGETISYRANGRDVTLNNEALIIKGNIRATNGIIQVINRVLLPDTVSTATETIAAQLEAAGNFNTLLELLGATDLLGFLEDPNAGPYTIFAPTDAAFAALLAETGYTIPQLITDFDFLTSILLYHAVDGVYTTADLASIDSLLTLEGESIEVDGTTLNSEAEIIDPDIEASNGIIQVIDAVLIPGESGGNNSTNTPPPTAASLPSPAPSVLEPGTPSPTGAASGGDTPSPTSPSTTTPSPSAGAATASPTFNATDGTLEPTAVVTDIGTVDNSTNATNLFDGATNTSAAVRADIIQL